MPKPAIDEIFQQSDSLASAVPPLCILEMANNHMGDVEHGLRILREFHQITSGFPQFHFAFKFQYRHLDTFIHPDYRGRMDVKYVRRFSETALTDQEFLRLKAEAEALGFITMCTPFDENSVERVIAHDYDILKVASASLTDWPMLEKVALHNKPVIASTGGATLEEIDRVVSFFQHRNKPLIIEHCVAEYPTAPERLQLNQIDLLKARYRGVPVGFSTHEPPDNFDAVRLAVAKGARTFEKHVAVKTDKYEINAYSAEPHHLRCWLAAAQQAYEMCGVVGVRAASSEKEQADLRQFRRGVFAARPIAKGERITPDNCFLAFPNQPGQLLANDLSKYTLLCAAADLPQNAPVVNPTKIDTRDSVYEIVTRTRAFLAEAGIPVSNQLDFEISHHYGIDRFYETGAVIITCINRAYAKKLIVQFPGQKHPIHMHQEKEETFHILHGKFLFTLNGEPKVAKAGDLIVVEKGTRHGFETEGGGIFEEISTTHRKSDSFYDDPAVGQNPSRKTQLTYWVD
jgi:sialic acid synthase SpsE/mannose-6-phosphate isomerase-like protein (cupin superfamily)